MADWQHAFLSKVILEEAIKEAVNARITTEFFRDERYQRVYEFLLQHWGTHGTAPDEDVVRQAFPTHDRGSHRTRRCRTSSSRCASDRKFVVLTAGLSEAADYIPAEDAHAMAMAIQEALMQSRLETSKSTDSDFTTARGRVEELLIERMDNPGRLRGISTGFKGIDFVTGGLQPEQFVVLLGTPKSFKSATLLAMAKAVHTQAKVPLFIGFEMSDTEQTRPHDVADLRCWADEDHEWHPQQQGVRCCSTSTGDVWSRCDRSSSRLISQRLRLWEVSRPRSRSTSPMWSSWMVLISCSRRSQGFNQDPPRL